MHERKQRQSLFDGRDHVLRDEAGEAYYCHTSVDGVDPAYYEGCLGWHLAIWRIPEQRNLVLAAAGMHAVVMYFALVMSNALMLWNARDGKVLAQPPLTDGFAVHDWLPGDLKLDLDHRPPEVERVLHLLSGVPTACALYLFFMGRTKQLVLFQLTMTILFPLKSIFQFSTVLPAADPKCFARTLRRNVFCAALPYLQRLRCSPTNEQLAPVDPAGRLVPDGVAWIFYERYGMPACNDMIFSGHTAMLQLSVLFTYKTLHQRHGALGWMLSLLLGLLMCTYAYVLISMHMHYMVDVLIALLLATALYTHTALRFWLWTRLNWLVGNPTGLDDGEPLYKPFPTYDGKASDDPSKV